MGAMIFPMMAQIDFSAIAGVRRQPKGLAITTTVNWLIKPFTMFALAWLFFMVIFKPWIPDALASQYLAGAILLGAAPCTAMVFVWSYLKNKNKETATSTKTMQRKNTKKSKKSTRRIKKKIKKEKQNRQREKKTL